MVDSGWIVVGQWWIVVGQWLDSGGQWLDSGGQWLDSAWIVDVYIGYIGSIVHTGNIPPVKWINQTEKTQKGSELKNLRFDSKIH